MRNKIWRTTIKYVATKAGISTQTVSREIVINERDELHRKAEAVRSMETTFIAATTPGTTLGRILLEAVQTYARKGFPGEWQLHHQGGVAGYLPREIIVRPDSTIPVQTGQVLAWNPSITGVKSEDTILIKEHGNEVLTAIRGWPMLEVHLNGQTFLRLACLEK